MSALKKELYQLHNDLRAAHRSYGLNSSQLETLRVLITFVGNKGGCIVFASNAAITRRRHTSERTVRRHVEELVAQEFLQRRDSNNGRRFRVADPDGSAIVYGLDLSPLFSRAAELAERAAAFAREEEARKFQKKRLLKLLYEAQSLGLPEGTMKEYCNMGRRVTVTADELSRACDEIGREVATRKLSTDELEHQGASPEAADLSAKAGQFVRHMISSKERVHIIDEQDPERDAGDNVRLLGKILTAAPKAAEMMVPRPQRWHELEEQALVLGGQCGMSRSLISGAIARCGKRHTAITILGIVQRFDEIRVPAAYFRAVTVGNRSERFDPMRLLSK
nr:plasmid replication protein RepC [Paracoccus saliphilus]